MRKRDIAAVLATTAVTVLVPFTVFQVSTANAASKAPQQEQPGAITIQSWIHADLTDNGLSGTDSDCFKISGAIVDQGGDPTWDNDAQFSAPTQATGSTAVTAASKECGDAVPAGGIVLVPPPAPGQYALAQYKLTAFYVDFTVHGQKGQFFITYAGDYNFSGGPLQVGGVTVPEGQSSDCTWVITGGTGAYIGLQGDGTCSANLANTFPYVWHTSTGDVWWTERPDSSRA
jgi:hypothetical protein